MRMAIYYLPRRDSALWRFGSAFLGYDAITGAPCEQTGLAGIDAGQIKAWTGEPRLYGFHATLKAPFRLADGLDAEALCTAAAKFCARERPVSLGVLAPDCLGSFIALKPVQHCSDLASLAARCVEYFDTFRAPMNEAERARRLQSKLTPRQIELMDLWGYPYVFDEFRFHMSLTGPLPADVRTPMLAATEQCFAPISEPVIVDSICVCEQTIPNRPFRLLQRFELCGSAVPSANT